MSRIRILSEHLANQIAAGEVVERPASVVKELVENSIDAGAKNISVQIEGSGTRLIRIVDNGEGMDEDDVLLSIERHATSKINDDSRLDAISTLGFRGEALPSIGSVSRLTILSRPQNKETGTRAELRYGTLHAVHEDGCAKGTIIEVRGLFGNVPARRKFLKSARTEQYHIEEVLRNQSLAHFETGFFLHVDQRPVLEFPVVTDPEKRVRDVFRYKGRLIPVESTEGNDVGVSIHGYLLEPETTTSSRNKLRILVNNRPVQDKMVRHAVVEGMTGFLMKGQSPSGLICLDLPVEQIDVNVHPAKNEIRFRQSSDIHRFIVRSVKDGVRNYQEQIRTDIFTVPPAPPVQEKKEEKKHVPPREEEPEASKTPPRSEPVVKELFTSQAPVERSCAAEQTSEPVATFTPPPVAEEHVADIEEKPSVTTHRVATQNASISRQCNCSQGAGDAGHRPVSDTSVCEQGDNKADSLPCEQLQPSMSEYSGLSVIGQLFNLYLLCERDGQLVVIDQHAAHERILYQQLCTAYQNRDIPRQNLMFPASLEVTVEQAEALEKYGDDITKLGFSLQHFGEETWVIKSVPALLGFADPAELLLETIDNLIAAGRKHSKIASRIDSLLSSMACKAAVKAGDKLAPEEMLELLVQMQSSKYFSHCPHGRPVIKSFSKRDIEKWFHRV